jgi:hypothetical protein
MEVARARVFVVAGYGYDERVQSILFFAGYKGGKWMLLAFLV